MSIFLLVGTALTTGFAIRLLRRWQIPMLVATIVGSMALAIILLAASSEPIDLFGRTLALDLSSLLYLIPAIAITGVLATFALLNFQSADQSSGAIIALSQGAFFFLSLAAIITAIALDSFPLASVAWAIGLIMLMFLATPHRAEGVGGAAQFILLTAIAAASLLVSNRFLELYPLTPENLDLVRSAVLFLAWGLGLMLAVAPLHIWLSSLADELPLLGTAFLVGIAQPVGVWLVLGRMSELSWLIDKSPLLASLLAAGIITAPIGALLALSEKRDARWLAYLSLVPLGHALIGIGLGTRLALVGALVIISSRALSIALVAGGLTFARTRPAREWQRLGALAILVGGFSLAGIPPTLGSVARLAIYPDLSANIGVIAILFASNAGALLATIRVAWQLIVKPVEDAAPTEESRWVMGLCTAVLIFLVLTIIALGIFPQVIADPTLAAMGNAGYLK